MKLSLTTTTLKLSNFKAVHALSLATLPPEDLLLQACWHAVTVMTGHTAQLNSIISHATAGMQSHWSALLYKVLASGVHLQQGC